MQEEPKVTQSDLISATKLIEELKDWDIYSFTNIADYHQKLIQAIDKSRKLIITTSH